MVSTNVGEVKYDISKNTFTFNGQPMNDKAMADGAQMPRCGAVIENFAIAYLMDKESRFLIGGTFATFAVAVRGQRR